MKKLIISLLGLTTLAVPGFAGPVESDSSKQVQQSYTAPAEQFYGDREWNLDLFGLRADTYNEYRNDRYLGVDHGYGGGIDVNYMFTRYLGAGLEGYAIDANDVVGQASANLIFRYPIPNTRFAPYGYAGGGVIFNGSRLRTLVSNGQSPASIRKNSDAEGMGQFGAGFEVRITPRIGVINDYSYNLVNGPDNNFGMFRSGIRFAF
ncbi:MAG: outer membrane beta-barrel protein [Chthoniobacterales bacterium]